MKWKVPRPRVGASNPTISIKAANILDTEDHRLLKKGAMYEVGRAHWYYVSSYLAEGKVCHCEEEQCTGNCHSLYPV